jgi:predicted glycoside hydrolase/deacetylase ChbG (UPF0249 family)
VSHRELIVNADDFGRSPGVNSGILRAHEEGIVTSATLMVRWSAAEEAAERTRGSRLGVGLHFDLGEWTYEAGEWRPLYEVVDAEDPRAVEGELARQLERFESLLGRPPTHIDSHQHVHRDEPARTAVLAAAERLGVAVRELTPGIAYDGSFYGQDGRGVPLPEAITPEALVRLIEGLPGGVTEICCHPASADDHETMYRAERLLELEALCDPRVAAAVDDAGISLRTFANVIS